MASIFNNNLFPTLWGTQGNTGPIDTTSTNTAEGNVGELQYNKNGNLEGVTGTAYEDGVLTLGNVANVKINGGVPGQILTVTDTGNLTFKDPVTRAQPQIKFTVPVNGTNQQFAHSELDLFADGTYAQVFRNGILIDTSDYTIEHNLLTVKPFLFAGDTLTVGATSTGAKAMGSIAALNLNGITTNVLHGDGTWSDVTHPSVGSVGALNLDGSVNHWLRGDGTFAELVVPGGNIGNINLNGNVTQYLRGDGNWTNIAVPTGTIANTNYDNNPTHFLRGDGSWVTPTTGAQPAGIHSQLQYNNNGGLGAITSMTSDGTVVTVNNVSNLKIGGATQNSVLTSDNTGALSWVNVTNYASIPRIQWDITANGVGQTFQSDLLKQYPSSDYMSVFRNGALIDNNQFTLNTTTGTITWIGNLRTGEAIDIIATASAGGTGGGGSVSQVSTAGSGLGFSLTGGPITSIGTVTLATPTASALRGSLTIGNVANANFNGNGSTYLRGNGTFGVINAVAGANTQIQFNDAGVMGATANMTYDIANNNFTVQGTTSLLDNVTVEGHIEPLNDNTYDLGSSTKRFRHVYVGPNSLTIGDIPISQSGSGINFGNSSVATEDFVVNSIANVPGGSNTHVQFNNNGTLGGSAKFTYDGNTMVVMSESSVLGPASFFRVSNTSSGALNAGRIRGTVANPLPVQVGDAAVVSFPMLTANGTATIGGITGFPSGASSFGARVTGLPTVDGGLLSQSLIFSPSSNVANASRTMMTLEYSNVFIATNAANSNVTIASASANSNVFIAASSANSNVTIAPADNATIRIGGGANTKIIMYTQNVPATATSTGTAGQIAFDQNYIYYCWATDQWKRSPLSTW